MAALYAVVKVFAVEALPSFVVVGAYRVGKTPVAHGEGGIVGYGLLEAVHGFAVVEGVDPDEAAIEPDARIFAGGGDVSRVGAEVEVGLAGGDCCEGHGHGWVQTSSSSRLIGKR